MCQIDRLSNTSVKTEENDKKPTVQIERVKQQEMKQIEKRNKQERQNNIHASHQISGS